MSVKTRCQTPGATFHTRITDQSVTVSVSIPIGASPQWPLSKSEAVLLEANLHNACEMALARYFPTA